MNKNLTILMIFLGSLFLLSCEDGKNLISVDDDNIFDTEVTKNSPRVTKENGNFAFVLKGENFSGTTNESVNFSNKKVVLTINLENYNKGKCIIKIKSDYSNELFTKEIQGNLIYSEEIEFDDYPEQIIIEFEDFSGTVKFALSQK